MQSFNGAHFQSKIGSDLAAKIDELCQRQQVTPFAVFLAVNAIVMGRHSGQSDICVGTPLAGRDQQELEPLIGHFINTVVIRTLLDDNPSFKSLLHRVNDSVLDAMDNQDIAFEKVVEAVNPKRSASHSPLFQTMLIFQNTPRDERNIEGLELRPLETDSATAKYDITIELFQNAANYELWFEYNSDLFNQSTVASLFDSFERVLNVVTDNADIQIDDIPFTDFEALKSQLAAEFSEFYLDAPNTIHEAFIEVAQKCAQFVAVKDARNEFTFHELDASSNQVASFLRSRGISVGDAVALVHAPTVEYVALFLGILKSGGIVVPIDVNAPSGRIGIILHEADAKIAFGPAGYDRSLSDTKFQGEFFELAQIDALSAEHSKELLCTPTKGTDTAALIFTSGSTGAPKARMFPMRVWSTLRVGPSMISHYRTKKVCCRKVQLGLMQAFGNSYGPCCPDINLFWRRAKHAKTLHFCPSWLKKTKSKSFNSFQQHCDFLSAQWSSMIARAFVMSFVVVAH